MKYFNVPTDIFGSFLSDKTYIQFKKYIFSLLPHFYLLVKHKFALRISGYFWSEGVAVLFDDHFAGKFDFHFDEVESEMEKV